MIQRIVFAGFGGQGVLFAGKTIAYAGMDSNLQISWLPSYGPEMRGGTANCSVILSDEPIGSPIISKPDVLIAMNKPSLDKFVDLVLPGGVIIYDSSLIDTEIQRNDVTIVPIPAKKLAEELGNANLGNMVMIGAYMKNSSVLTMEEIQESIKEHVPKSKSELAQLNIMMVKAGFEY